VMTVLMCWCVQCWWYWCVDALMCWCSVCWYLDVLMRWLMRWCVDVLMTALVCWCVAVLMCSWHCVGVLMCWCVVLICCSDVFVCRCVGVLMCCYVGAWIFMLWLTKQDLIEDTVVCTFHMLFTLQDDDKNLLSSSPRAKKFPKTIFSEYNNTKAVYNFDFLNFCFSVFFQITKMTNLDVFLNYFLLTNSIKPSTQHWIVHLLES